MLSPEESDLRERRRQLVEEAYEGDKSPKRISSQLDWLMTLPEFQGMRRNTITKWAGELGLSRKIQQKRCLWTRREENTLLESMVGVYTVPEIRRKLRKNGFFRGELAIRKRINELGMSIKTDTYSILQVAAAIGCSDHVVRRWLEKGWLKGKMPVSQGSPARINPKALAQFIVDHTEAVNEFKPDIPFLVSLLQEWWLDSSKRKKYMEQKENPSREAATR